MTDERQLVAHIMQCFCETFNAHRGRGARSGRHRDGRSTALLGGQFCVQRRLAMGRRNVDERIGRQYWRIFARWRMWVHAAACFFIYK